MLVIIKTKNPNKPIQDKTSKMKVILGEDHKINSIKSQWFSKVTEGKALHLQGTIATEVLDFRLVDSQVITIATEVMTPCQGNHPVITIATEVMTPCQGNHPVIAIATENMTLLQGDHPVIAMATEDLTLLQGGHPVITMATEAMTHLRGNHPGIAIPTEAMTPLQGNHSVITIATEVMTPCQGRSVVITTATKKKDCLISPPIDTGHLGIRGNGVGGIPGTVMITEAKGPQREKEIIIKDLAGNVIDKRRGIHLEVMATGHLITDHPRTEEGHLVQVVVVVLI